MEMSQIRPEANPWLYVHYDFVYLEKKHYDNVCEWVVRIQCHYKIKGDPI